MHQALRCCNLERICQEWCTYPKVQIYKDGRNTEPRRLHQTNQFDTNNIFSRITDDSQVTKGKKIKPISKPNTQLLTMPPLQQQLWKVRGKRVASLLFTLRQLCAKYCFPRLNRYNGGAFLVYGPSCITQNISIPGFSCGIPVIVLSI